MSMAERKEHRKKRDRLAVCLDWRTSGSAVSPEENRHCVQSTRRVLVWTAAVAFLAFAWGVLQEFVF
jgi:hypothetical protein